MNPSDPKPEVPDVSSVYPQPGVSTPIISQADIIAASRRRKRWLMLAVVLVVLLLGVAGGGGYWYTRQNSSEALPTITYNNGVSGSYKLPFYPNYEIKKIPASTISATNTTQAEALYAKEGVQGKAPLVLQIGEMAFDQKLADTWKPCPAGAAQAMVIPNKYFDKDIVLCGLQAQGKDIAYFGVLNANSKTYVFMALQDINFDQASTDQAASQAAIDAADMMVYQADLKTMLGALAPASN